MESENNGNTESSQTAPPTFTLPVGLIIGAFLLELSAKSIAKALASGLQDRANIEGGIAIIAGICLLIGIILLVRTVLLRRRNARN